MNIEPIVDLPEEEQKIVLPREFIFENRGMLLALLIGQKNRIFERMISSEMMGLMIDHFIKTPPEYIHHEERCIFVEKFLDCLMMDFGVDMVEIKSNNVFAQGSHGKVYESNRKPKNGTDKNGDKELIKILMNHKGTENESHVFDNGSLSAHCSTIYDYASELFTYIVWVVVLRYIGVCNKTKQIDSVSGDIRTDYTKYIVKINKPFIAIRTGFDVLSHDVNGNKIFDNLCKPSHSHADRCVRFRDNIRLKFCIGYYMERHKRSLNDLLQKTDETINYPLIKTTLTNVFSVLHEFAKFSNLGIYLMHRDITPNNIVIDDNGNVTLIDFGMALIGIKFQNNMTWNHGTYFKKEYIRTIRSDFDAILFMVMLIQFYEESLLKLNVAEYFKKIISCDQTTKNRYNKKYELAWLHPYVVQVQNPQDHSLSHNITNYLSL